MFRPFAFLFAALALGSAVAPAQDVPGRDMPQAERDACLAKGGYIQRAGMYGFEQCFHRFSDGGKACKGKKDCQGRCLLAGDPGGIRAAGTRAKGVCAPDSNIFGCSTEIENGRTAMSSCVD